mgnify:CR=1 FL=1
MFPDCLDRRWRLRPLLLCHLRLVQPLLRPLVALPVIGRLSVLQPR